MRVLIADDQRSVGTSLADLVRHCNHEIVAVVGSGVEAIQAYNQHRPDIVLMDYWMPKLNGATACRNIVAKDPTARIILVSGWAPSSGIIGGSGALALLAKPVDLNQLAAALNDAAQTLPRPAGVSAR
jgi:two-component system chemotaxis response regulator CheY